MFRYPDLNLKHRGLMIDVLSAVIGFLCLLGTVRGTTFEEFEPAWKNHLIKHGLGRTNLSRAADYPATVQMNGNTYTIPNIQFLNGPPPRGPPPAAYPAGPATLTLIPGGIVDSDVKCGGDNRNFCNYPELPFIETLNIPSVLASPNKLNRLPSGRCPDGYSKLPTMDCLNIAAAFIETTCCVYNSPPVTLTDYCSNRQGLLFSASFELCDGRNFIISGSNAWQVDDTFRILGGPYSLGTLTGGTVSGSVDSALVDSSCNVGFFVGTTLKWMNFPGKTPSTDQTLSALLGTINSNLCGGSTSCVPTMVNFAVCPNNGYCMVSVSLLASSGTVYKQLFFLAPGFNSFISAQTTPPGIAVLNQFDLASNFRSYIAATYIKTTNEIAFIDGNNNVFFYDAVGKLLSGPTNLFDLFGVCGGVGSTTGNGYTIYIPIPIYGAQPNGTAYGGAPDYQAPPASASYGPPPQQATNYAPPSYGPSYGPPPTAPNLYRNQPAPPADSYQNSSPPQAAQYSPQPAPQYAAQAPVPQYQAPPATQPPQYQPPAAPQYQPPAPQYSPALTQQYDAPPPPPATPAPQQQYQPPPPPPPPQYQAPSQPAPSYQQPAPASYQAPPSQYQQPQYQQQPAPAAYEGPAQTNPNSQPAPAPQPQPQASVDTHRDQRPPEALVDPQTRFPPQGPPIRPRTPAPPPVASTDPMDNTVFKPAFQAPLKEFFDVSAFIRKGDIDRFQPMREVKLV